MKGCSAATEEYIFSYLFSKNWFFGFVDDTGSSKTIALFTVLKKEKGE